VLRLRRPQPRRLLAGLGAVLVLCAASAASAAPIADGRGGDRAASASSGAGAPARLSAFGVAAGGNIQNLAPDELAHELDLYAAGGADWVRIDVNWSVIQRGGPSSYDWAPFDQIGRAHV